MKVLAMYLPQFYRTKENDEWWGEGFTDWIATKGATPLFTGHKQPHVPYKHNYYNLLHRDTMEWQAGLLKEYGIDGLVFYHYYFKDGRMTLEKPAENLLAWTDIHMPFCFSWANESWIRSWSNIQEGNPWSQLYDGGACRQIAGLNSNSMDGILLEQSYGDEDQWTEHFNYLLPFFKDNRYLCEAGRPMFIFHRPNSIPCLNEMLQCWNRLAKENGLSGIYAIGVNTERAGFMDEVVHMEPQYTMESYCQMPFKEQYVRTKQDYDEIWESIIRKRDNNMNCLSGFVSYDDTPRHGRGGVVVTGASAEKFKKYMQLLFCKAKRENARFIFLNAWNEWGEGMYLEPDEENGYEYLEAFSYARSHANEVQCEFDEKYLTSEKGDKPLLRENDNLRSQLARFKTLFRVTDSWMKQREQSVCIIGKLQRLNLRCIAIYGMGSLGRHLVWEIEKYNSEHTDAIITLKYGIDQSGKPGDYSFPVYRLTDTLPDIDAVIITVTYEFGKIRKQLEEVLDCEIVSLEKLLTE